MPFNLGNRSFLKLIDFSKRDLVYILDLAQDLKRAKHAGTEVQRLRGGHPWQPVMFVISRKVQGIDQCE